MQYNKYLRCIMLGPRHLRAPDLRDRRGDLHGPERGQHSVYVCIGRFNLCICRFKRYMGGAHKPFKPNWSMDPAQSTEVVDMYIYIYIYIYAIYTFCGPLPRVRRYQNSGVWSGITAL